MNIYLPNFVKTEKKRKRKTRLKSPTSRNEKDEITTETAKIQFTTILLQFMNRSIGQKFASVHKLHLGYQYDCAIFP